MAFRVLTRPLYASQEISEVRIRVSSIQPALQLSPWPGQKNVVGGERAERRSVIDLDQK
jgi:hypothetical protein